MFYVLGLLLGLGLVHTLAQLPNTVQLGAWGATLGLLMLLAVLLRRYRPWYRGERQVLSPIKLLCILWAIWLGFSIGVWQAQQRLSQLLAPVYWQQTLPLTVQVDSLVQYGVDRLQFTGRLLERPKGLPERVRITWSLATRFHWYRSFPVANPPQLKPGEVWAMSLQLKPPLGRMNPGGFDSERHFFAQDLMALGAVKGQPQRLYDRPQWGQWVERWRDQVRTAMAPYVQNKRYGAVITALVMGDQQGIAPQDWQLFQRTGITHLVSISGSHITMLSALSAWLLNALFKGLGWQGAWQRPFVYGVGIAVAFVYCLLAGWGVPAQRTFIMLLLFYLANYCYLPQSLLAVFLIAAMLIALIDPWSMLSTGFYLSFGAVAVLQWVLHSSRRLSNKASPKAKIWAFVKGWLKVQGSLSIALAPFLIYFFQQLSLISPVVNAYAIFIIGTVVTPLALVLGVSSHVEALSGWNHALAMGVHALLDYTLQLSEWLSRLPFALIDFSAPSPLAMCLALLAVAVVVLSPTWGLRALGMGVLVAVLSREPAPLAHGEWRLWAFDIGQGGAILVQTRQHTLLFDSGNRLSPQNEASQRVLLPAFRALGVQRLHTLVVSHADLDHSGGLAGLVANMPIDKVYASFQVDRFLDREAEQLAQPIHSLNPDLQYFPCQAGHAFEQDGVRFRFLHPPPSATLPEKSKNEQSCVLSIEGKHHRALLTGDITQAQEIRLPLQGRYHVVQVPHHGSKTSSSATFIARTQAELAFAQFGLFNRFAHPHPSVVQRWQQAGVQWLATAEKGAVRIDSGAQGLRWYAWRDSVRRYWHLR